MIRHTQLFTLLFLFSFVFLFSNLAYGQMKLNSADLGPFSYGSAEEVGWDSGVLQRLVDSTHLWTDKGNIMGAEILIIKDDKIVLHDAYGWSDQEENSPLEKNSIFRIRSMTKPFVAVSIVQLQEKAKLNFTDKVSQHLPEMQTEKSKDITIHQLLTHTAGMRDPYKANALDWSKYNSLQSAVKKIGADGPEFESGSFIYSDEGTAVLAYLIEKLSTKSLDEYFEENIFEPLGMSSTLFDPAEHMELSNRINSTYYYMPRQCNFIRYWDKNQELMIPYLIGAMGIFSTTIDYAKFLKSLMDHGKFGEQALISEDGVNSILSPYTSGAIGNYGYLMAMDINESNEVASFSHEGSDGTQAIAFPEINTMVFYYTQSRGNDHRVNFKNTLRSIDYFKSYINSAEYLSRKRNQDQIAIFNEAHSNDINTFDSNYLGEYSIPNNPNISSQVFVEDGKIRIILPREANMQLKEVVVLDSSRLYGQIDFCEPEFCNINFNNEGDTPRVQFVLMSGNVIEMVKVD